MRITDYPDLLRTKGKEPMPQAWDADKQDWTPALDSAATLGEIKTALGGLNEKDFATQATLAQVLTKLGDLSTAAKQDAAKGVLDTISSAVAQRATEQTLAQVLAKLADPATAAGQDAAKTVLDTISNAVATRATELTLGEIKTALTDGTQQVKLTGNLTELFGASLSDRPPASSVSVGATFMVVGTDIVYQSNGTDWVVIS